MSKQCHSIRTCLSAGTVTPVSGSSSDETAPTLGPGLIYLNGTVQVRRSGFRVSGFEQSTIRRCSAALLRVGSTGSDGRLGRESLHDGCTARLPPPAPGEQAAAPPLRDGALHSYRPPRGTPCINPAHVPLFFQYRMGAASTARPPLCAPSPQTARSSPTPRRPWKVGAQLWESTNMHSTTASSLDCGGSSCQGHCCCLPVGDAAPGTGAHVHG